MIITSETYRLREYFQIPKQLFRGKYRKLSNNARAVYALLYSNLNNSIKNRWENKSGQPYVTFKQDNIAENVCISRRTVVIAIQQLEELKAIYIVRRLNKPNIIYLDGLEDFEEESPCRAESAPQKDCRAEFAPCHAKTAPCRAESAPEYNNINNNITTTTNPSVNNSVVVPSKTDFPFLSILPELKDLKEQRLKKLAEQIEKAHITDEELKSYREVSQKQKNPTGYLIAAILEHYQYKKGGGEESGALEKHDDRSREEKDEAARQMLAAAGYTAF